MATSTMNTHRFAATLAVAACLTTPAVAQKKKPQDVIRRTNGQVIRPVEVLTETASEVTYKRRGKDQSLPAADVESIEWSSTGDTYSRAVFAASRSEFGLAANLYQEASDNASRPAFKAHAAFKAAETLYLAATADKSQAQTATAALDKWLRGNADHRMMPRARRLLGDSWLIAGQPDQAIAAYKALETEAGSRNLHSTWIAKAKFGQGKALVAKKDFQNARTAYVSASATLGAGDAGDPAVAALLVAAKIGEGECYIAEKRWDEAGRFFSSLASRATSKQRGLKAAARCGEAQAVFEEAAAKKDVKGIQRAQKMFAEVSSTDIMDSEASAKAVYYLGKALLALGAASEGKDYAKRADAMFRNVLDEYPDSGWSVEARRALKK